MPNVEEILFIFEKLNPNPKTELYYINNYTLLVAVMLSAQSTDASVNKVTEGLFKIANTPEEMLSLGVDNLIKHVNSIGLYRNKSKNIIKSSEILVELYNSDIPRSLGDLILLPGVGTKTAKVVLNCAFGELVMPVDTHVLRVSNRLGIIEEKYPEKAEKKLEKIIPKNFLDRAHHWFVLHGRYVCKSIKPSCNICAVKGMCKFFLHNNL